MSHDALSFVYSDALRLIQHRHYIDDLSLAFELLGLRISESDLLSDSILAQFEGIEPLDDVEFNDDEDDEDDYGEDEFGAESTEGVADEYNEFDEREHAKREPMLPRGKMKPNFLASSSLKRSMVSYLLTADERTSATDDGAPVVESVPIESRVQQVQKRLAVPDSEAWRVATDVADTAPRAHWLGKIDIRACVNLIAQRKPIEVLPRLSASRSSRDPTIFIDARFYQGVFGADVEQLIRSLQSMGIFTAKRTQPIIRRFSQWFTLDFSANSLLPLEPETCSPWCVIITGGQAATRENLVDVKLLSDRMMENSRVTIVWIGDELPKLPREETRTWLAYRA